ncbi:V-type ATP synthase subunit I [uncultured Trichococcus sp.]|uniref:V-type ATP synthase subunit I n=1 Tax=uncultured Trichococcus sp. TaxID=189665 RepID=UPI0029C804FF|nr:V-type ATP synthase subunit I [uncultured Trichococcus sp.]
MAIAKMKKITLISFHEKKEQLLTAIQTLQSLEVIDLPAAKENLQSLSPKERESIEQSVKKTESYLENVTDALSFLQPYLKKEALLKRYTAPKQSMSLEELKKATSEFSEDDRVTAVLSLKNRLKELEDTRKDLYEQEDFLIQWKKLSFNPKNAEAFDHISVKVGTIPQTLSNDYIENVTSSPLVYTEEIFQNKESYGAAIFYDPIIEADVKELLDSNHFQVLLYNYELPPAEALVEVQELIKRNREEQKQLMNDLSGMKADEWQLMLLSEYYYAKLQREKSQQLLVNEKHLFVIQGWLEEDKVEEIKRTLTDTVSGDEYALLVDDAEESDLSDIPTVLKNNSIVTPFESVTAMYSLPKYNEIDPTPLLTPFYLLFFGMMIADVGYGLVLFIGTFLALKFLNIDKGMRKNIQFFHILAYPSILWGLVYGSFFGIELPVSLLSTSKDANTILLISVVFGVVQIMFGLGIKAFLSLRDKNPLGAISDSIGWLGIIIGIIFILFGMMLFPSQVLVTVGAAMAITSAVAIVLATAMASENKALGVGAGLYNLYGITSYIGDMVSYTRLMALGVSGGSIAVAFNMIIDFLPFWARITIGAVLFVLLHTINFGLSMLSAYVHGARLVFVEFFGKFYEGGGKALNPLKTEEKYINLKK